MGRWKELQSAGRLTFGTTEELQTDGRIHADEGSDFNQLMSYTEGKVRKENVLKKSF